MTRTYVNGHHGRWRQITSLHPDLYQYPFVSLVFAEMKTSWNERAKRQRLCCTLFFAG